MIDDKKLRMTVYGNVNDINDPRQPGQETEWTPAEAAKNQRTTQTAGFDYRKKEKKWDATGYMVFSHTNTESVTDVNRINFIESGNTSQNSHSHGENKKMKIDTYHDFHTVLGAIDIYTSNRSSPTIPAITLPPLMPLKQDSKMQPASSASALINDSRNVASTQSHNLYGRYLCLSQYQV